MPVVWNHNTHFHGRLLRLLPPRGSAALDVGCGDGSFATLLAGRYQRVVALDPDAEQVSATSARCANLTNVEVRQGDFLQSKLPSEAFDAVTALASFHHMPFADAAAEADRVLRPGGRLVVLGVWTDRQSPTDLALNVMSTALNTFLRLRRGPDVMSAPATLERTKWRGVKADATACLPGARLRRHLLWRYALVWDKPLRNQ
jgi:ubiquinone/menaquinone biosynthesis C-methylase UbiE